MEVKLRPRERVVQTWELLHENRDSLNHSGFCFSWLESRYSVRDLYFFEEICWCHNVVPKNFASTFRKFSHKNGSEQKSKWRLFSEESPILRRPILKHMFAMWQKWSSKGVFFVLSCLEKKSVFQHLRPFWSKKTLNERWKFWNWFWEMLLKPAKTCFGVRCTFVKKSALEGFSSISQDIDERMMGN